MELCSATTSFIRRLHSPGNAPPWSRALSYLLFWGLLALPRRSSAAKEQDPRFGACTVFKVAPTEIQLPGVVASTKGSSDTAVALRSDSTPGSHKLLTSNRSQAGVPRARHSLSQPTGVSPPAARLLHRSHTLNYGSNGGPSAATKTSAHAWRDTDQREPYIRLHPRSIYMYASTMGHGLSNSTLGPAPRLSFRAPTSLNPTLRVQA
ncbi:hypothetical protein DVH05_016215 [Phytophthora capsici]|nr:hypothetical protein DVH05_016215 [Phytophthora capsici]